jgi:hypothetical protein
MKKQAHTMIAMFVLVGSMAVAAQAQGGHPVLIANIPFDFNVGNKTLPAGEYTVREVNAGPALLQLQSKDGRESAMVLMNTVIGKAQESAKLVFHRYGSRYFFAQAWIDGDNSGLQAPRSRAERAVERELASTERKTETIALRHQ